MPPDLDEIRTMEVHYARGDDIFDRHHKNSAAVFKDAAEYLKLKQGPFAKRLGTDVTYLSRIMNGKARAGREMFRKLSRLLQNPSD